MDDLLKRLLADRGMSDDDFQQLVEQEKARIATPIFNYDGLNLDDTKALKLSELNYNYSKTLTEGFTTNATGTPIHFKYGETDQLNFTKRSDAVALGTSQPTFVFGTSDGVFQFTTDQWRQIAVDAESHEMTTYDKLDGLRNDVDTAYQNSDLDGLKAIVW